MEDMDLENRIVSTGLTETDRDIENSLRPKTLEDYIGQDKVKENLAVYIEAARTRGEALCCCTVRPDWARPPWRALLPMRWA